MKTKLILLLILVAPALAQSISPVVSECGKRCSGEFTITNPGIRPMFVTVQPFSFSLDAATGKSILRALDSTASVKLDEMSARVGPLSSHTFGYHIQCEAVPCLITLYAEVTGGHTDTGLAVRVLLPSVVYACTKQKGCRAESRKAAGLVD